MKTPSITFQTRTQASLFNHEIVGQLSDGQWENSRPYDHHSIWCRAEVKYARSEDTPVGRNFYALKSNYSLVGFAKQHEVCRQRMLRYVRIGKRFGFSFLDCIKDALDLDGQASVPTYEGAYWDAQRDKLSGYNLSLINEVTEDESIYSRAELFQDLKAMELAMRTDIVLQESRAKSL